MLSTAEEVLMTAEDASTQKSCRLGRLQQPASCDAPCEELLRRITELAILCRP